MQVLFFIAFLILVGVAIFAVQNSGADPVDLKFLFWEFRTSLMYTLLGAVISGALLTLLFWIPSSIKGSMKRRRLKREIQDLEMKQSKPAPTVQEPDKPR